MNKCVGSLAVDDTGLQNQRGNQVLHVGSNPTRRAIIILWSRIMVITSDSGSENRDSISWTTTILKYGAMVSTQVFDTCNFYLNHDTSTIMGSWRNWQTRMT